MSSVILHNGTVPVSNGRALSNDAFVADVNDITGETDKTPSEVASSLSDINSALGAAITAKGGTVASDSTLSDKAEEVGSIPGGINPDSISTIEFRDLTINQSLISLPNVKTAANMFNGTTFTTDELTVLLPECVESVSFMFSGFHSSMNKLTIKLSDDITTLQNFLRSGTFGDSCEVHLLFSTRNVVKWGQSFYGDYITSIIGDLDFTSADSIDSSYFRWSITDFSVVPNTIRISCTFNSTRYSDDTFVSIANGLDGSVSSKTITVGSAIANLNRIIGFVNEGVFIMDSDGSVSLPDFITNTKGWTIA